MNHKSKRFNRKRLSMDIPQPLFDKMDQAREKRKTTITRYVIKAIINMLKIEL